MPLRDGPNGLEAFYPAVTGPIRRTGSRTKPPIEPWLRGSETIEGLADMFDQLIEWMTKLYGMDRIGRKGIQVLLDWMDLVNHLVGDPLPVAYIPAPPAGRWAKQSIKADGGAGDDLVELADKAVAITQGWYAADHGTAADHQLVIDAVTLAFRLSIGGSV